MSHPPEHSHGHSHEHSHPHASDWLKIAIGLTAGFAVVEALAGWLAQSLALLSDAAHMITDVGALLVSALALWISRRPANHHSSYGYLRAEVLGAMINVAVIWTLSALLVMEAFERLRSPVEVRGPWVVVVGALGLIVNLVILGHSREHDHDSASVAIRAARLHILSDALGSVGATLSGIGIWWAGWIWLDPLVTFLISGAMFVMSWDILRKTLAVLMEFAPSEIDVPALEKALTSLPGVQDIHDLHVWSLSIGKASASAHIRVSQADPQAVCRQATELLKTQFGIQHTTLQVEQGASSETCVQSCR